MFTLARKAVTFCSAHCSLSYIEKTCNSMLFLSSLTQRFPNHGKDPCQPSLCLLEHLDFYCSTLNRVFKNSWFSRPTTNFYNLASHPWIKGGKCCFDQKGANFYYFLFDFLNITRILLKKNCMKKELRINEEPNGRSFFAYVEREQK